MEEHVLPAESRYGEQVQHGPPFSHPPVMEDLKAEARKQGLWNLFLPNPRWGAGLTNLEYAPLAEITGWSPSIAPEALNCSAPDTGNMELLAEFGTAEQQERWLVPMLDGEIRSCFSMTEPDVASSDAQNIDTRIERNGDHYIITGRKWWSSGAMSERCKFAVLMGVSNTGGDRHRRHSMIIVPLETPGVQIRRSTTVFGYDDGPHGGHAEILYDGVQVPAANLLGEEGAGFAIAQARLGPGRIHHCMRLVGIAERALHLLCQRVEGRVTFGRTLAEHGVIQDWIAEARVQIEQVRLLVLKTAWLMDTVGNKGARGEISAIKVAAPRLAVWVLDRAIQAHGGGGVSQDFPLASMYAYARILQIADGPDEVHKLSLARRERGRHAGLVPVSG
jgi:acyl-CoA dehydrogenase